MYPFYVYLYYANGILIYVGKATENPYRRYTAHLQERIKNGLSYMFSEVDKIEIISFPHQVDMEIVELYLIMKYKPICNTKDLNLHIEPSIKVCKIPKAVRYSMNDFYDTFGIGEKQVARERFSKEEFFEFYDIELKNRERDYQIKQEILTEKQKEE